MKSEYFLLTSVLLLLSTTTIAQQVIVLNTAGNPPLNTHNQSGFMDKISEEMFQHIGYTLKTVHLPAERGLRNSNAGIVDGEMSRVKGIDKLYPNLIRVPEKIMDWEFVVFSNKSIDLHHGWSSLNNRRLTYINGWKILEKHVPASAIITKTHTAEQMFLLFEKNRVDNIIYEHWAGLLLKKTRQLNQIKMQKPPLAIREMFIYLHKKHKKLIPKLAEVLRQMKQSGRYQEIKNTHLKPLE